MFDAATSPCLSLRHPLTFTVTIHRNSQLQSAMYTMGSGKRTSHNPKGNAVDSGTVPPVAATHKKGLNSMVPTQTEHHRTPYATTTLVACRPCLSDRRRCSLSTHHCVVAVLLSVFIHTHTPLYSLLLCPERPLYNPRLAFDPRGESTNPIRRAPPPPPSLLIGPEGANLSKATGHQADIP